MKPIIAAFILLTPLCNADWYAGYIHYRVEPELSKITLSLEMVRGSNSVERFVANRSRHEAEGKYLTYYYDSGNKTVVKEETIDGHTIKTILDIFPPTGQGELGALPRCHCTIWIDGEKRLEKELYGDVSSEIHQVVVYTEENYICISGTQPDEYLFPREADGSDVSDGSEVSEG